jgi:DNA-directed RNA polymerase sigma subunit (sigma70/sigma32)
VNSLVILAAALLFVFTLETDMPRRYQRLTPESHAVNSYEEVAEMLAKDEGHKVSRQRIQAIEASAFRKMRAALAARGIKASDILPDG